MNRIVKKLISRRGESLIESIAAILLFTMASVAFLSMVSASTNINQTVTEREAQYSAELNYAEDPAHAASGTDISVEIIVGNDDAHPITVSNVGIAQKNDGAIYAYYVP